MAAQFRILSLVFLFLYAPLAAGADKVSWYQVEVIVFARPGAPVDSERWPVEVVAPPGERRELVPWRGYTGPDSVPFQRLPNAALQMGKELERMRAAGDLIPLLHTGWLQPGLAREESIAVNVRSEDEGNGWVEGSLRLVLSRYLHLEANMVFHPKGDEQGVAGQPVYQLVESRRMRSREFHYLDHPLFGVLATVTPYEASAKRSAR